MLGILKRLANRYLGRVTLMAAALYATIFASLAAAQFDSRAEEWVANQITMWIGIANAQFVIPWFMAIAAIWLGLFSWSREWHREYETIDEKLPSKAVSDQSKHTSIRPDDAHHLHNAEPVTLPGLYVGNIVVSAGSIQDDHRLDLAILGFNGTGKALMISEITGYIRAGGGNLRDMGSLEIPALREPVRSEPGTEFIVVLHQHLKPAQAKAILADLEKGNTALDLRALKIRAATVNDISVSAELPLWGGVALRRRDDIVSNRITYMSVGVATSPLTITATGTLTDASGNARKR